MKKIKLIIPIMAAALFLSAGMRADEGHGEEHPNADASVSKSGTKMNKAGSSSEEHASMKNMDHSSMEMDKKKETTKTKKSDFTAVGLVKAIKDNGKVLVLKHGDVKGLMKGMEMPFTLNSAKLSKGIAVGDRIEFGLVKGGKWYTVNSVKKLARQLNGEGEITAIRDNGLTFVLDHDDIGDTMKAMTMPYKLKNKKVGKGFKVGDEIAFTLEKDGKRFILVKIKSAD